MSTYICHQCDARIRVTPNNGEMSVYAEVCPVCESDEFLEYL